MRLARQQQLPHALYIFFTAWCKPKATFAGIIFFSPIIHFIHAAEPKVLMNWHLVAGNLPVDINLTAGQHVSVISVPESTAFWPSRLGLQAELTSGHRNEFEWRSAKERVFYKHYEGGELWVGFRLAITQPGKNGSTCFFQIGPVRDGSNQTKGIGYYQLLLRGADKPMWTWREFPARAAKPGQKEATQPRILNPTAPEKGYTTSIGTFNREQTDTWVVQVRMRALTEKAAETGDEGMIKVWRNGELVFQRSAPNALPGDYTRVKWGPYIGESALVEPITAIYSDFIIAEAGGDDGYRLVAPAELVSLEMGKPWSRVLTYPPGATSARITGLPAGWTFDPEGRRLAGQGDPRFVGQRLRIEYLDTKGGTLRQNVWTLTDEQPRVPDHQAIVPTI